MTGMEDWLRRIRLGEDTTLELKRVVLRTQTHVEDPHPDGLADELAGMANAAGGTLILGVDDASKQILGIPYTALDTVEKWLSGICQDRVKPPLDIQTRHIELPDAGGELRPVIVVTVPRSLMVHRSPNGYFKRVAHAKREMTPDALARLFEQRSKSRLMHFDEQAVPGTALADADALLMKPFLRDGEGELTQQLRRLRLLTEDEGVQRLSVAGVLLCSDHPARWLPSARVQAVAYRGLANDPAEQVDAKDFSGPIGQQVWDAFHFARLHMQVPASKHLGRVDHPQYSLRAVFEAVVNAVAHRDYSMGGAPIRLHLFADRLELYSPGALPNSMTLDSMGALSIPRNEAISSLFSRYYPVNESGLGRQFLMDRRGSGVDVILAESKRLSGRMPQYDNLADLELRLTIFAAAPPK